MKILNMTPTTVPDEAKASRPDGQVLPVGPPRGVSGNECATVEAMHTIEQVDGRPWPCFRDYWRPTPQQLELLNNGGFLELSQYTDQMIMHSIQVWGDPGANRYTQDDIVKIQGNMPNHQWVSFRDGEDYCSCRITPAGQEAGR